MAKVVYYSTTDFEMWADTVADTEAIFHVGEIVSGRDRHRVYVPDPSLVPDRYLTAQWITDRLQYDWDNPPPPGDWPGSKAGFPP